MTFVKHITNRPGVHNILEIPMNQYEKDLNRQLKKQRQINILKGMMSLTIVLK